MTYLFSLNLLSVRELTDLRPVWVFICIHIALFSGIHEEDIEWLNNNFEPWEEVKERWNKTKQIRHELEYTDVHDFITHWKVLKSPAAPELVSISMIYSPAENLPQLPYNFVCRDGAKICACDINGIFYLFRTQTDIGA